MEFKGMNNKRPFFEISDQEMEIARIGLVATGALGISRGLSMGRWNEKGYSAAIEVIAGNLAFANQLAEIPGVSDEVAMATLGSARSTVEEGIAALKQYREAKEIE